MAAGSTFENDLAKLIFQATAIANLADNAAGSPLTQLFISLHTADPQAGNQTTNEITYGSYARVAVNRTSGGWTVTTNVVNPAATISFPAGTSGAVQSAGFFAVGTLTSGAGKVLVSGTVSPAVAYGNGITPQLTTATALTIT